MSNVPVLYAFRRCPYVMRARFALQYAGITPEYHEVDLKNKPQAMLDLSPKGTVPVLRLPDGKVIDESFDVMRWALAQHDPEGWWNDAPEMMALFKENDTYFRLHSDHYKYPFREPTKTQEEHRDLTEVFLKQLAMRLENQAFLFGDQRRWIDVAIFPFVRRVAIVDRDWFASTPYKGLQAWLAEFEAHPYFEAIMLKQPA